MKNIFIHTLLIVLKINAVLSQNNQVNLKKVRNDIQTFHDSSKSIKSFKLSKGEIHKFYNDFNDHTFVIYNENDTLRCPAQRTDLENFDLFNKTEIIGQITQENNKYNFQINQKDKIKVFKISNLKFETVPIKYQSDSLTFECGTIGDSLKIVFQNGLTKIIYIKKADLQIGEVQDSSSHENTPDTSETKSENEIFNTNSIELLSLLISLLSICCILFVFFKWKKYLSEYLKEVSSSSDQPEKRPDNTDSYDSKTELLNNNITEIKNEQVKFRSDLEFITNKNKKFQVIGEKIRPHAAKICDYIKYVDDKIIKEVENIFKNKDFDNQTFSLVQQLLGKYFASHDQNKIGQINRICKDLINNIAFSGEIFERLQDEVYEDDAIISLNKFIYLNGFEKFLSSTLILIEELSKLSKFSTPNNKYLNKIEIKFQPLINDFLLQTKKLTGFEINYIPLLTLRTEQLNLRLDNKSELNYLYNDTIFKLANKDEIVEIKKYGFKRLNNIESEYTEAFFK